MITAMFLVQTIIAYPPDPEISPQMVFALLDQYHGKFQDVSFLHEGTMTKTGGSQPEPANVYQFQNHYTYRNDGATLLDTFGHRSTNQSDSRRVSAILANKLEILEATPDADVPIKDRTPETGPGGPGSLAGPCSPERLFLPYYFATLTNPEEHELKLLGWEVIDGHRCLKIEMLSQPRPALTGWVGALPYFAMWIDLARDGYPLRVEFRRGAEVEFRTDVTRMDQVRLPDGHSMWFPAQAVTQQFLDMEPPAKIVHTKAPVYTETHGILTDTIKFNQKLNDRYFSAKTHALIKNEEQLRKLEHGDTEKKRASVRKPASDPESRQKRLDDALAEADRQALRLEASSAAREDSGWQAVLYRWAFLVPLFALAAALLVRYRRSL